MSVYIPQVINGATASQIKDSVHQPFGLMKKQQQSGNTPICTNPYIYYLTIGKHTKKYMWIYRNRHDFNGKFEQILDYISVTLYNTLILL